MADPSLTEQFAEDDTPVEALLPDDTLAEPQPDADIADLDQALDEAQGVAATPEALIVTDDPPPPLGKSWAFNFPDRAFIGSHGAALPVRGLATMRGWIEKALHTEAGASPIHPPEYGLERHLDGIGEPASSHAFADLERRISDCLTFHERVTAVEDFRFASDPNDDYYSVAFTVVLDDEATVNVTTTLP